MSVIVGVGMRVCWCGVIGVSYVGHGMSPWEKGDTRCLLPCVSCFVLFSLFFPRFFLVYISLVLVLCCFFFFFVVYWRCSNNFTFVCVFKYSKIKNVKL